jgi:hypothetical protein
MNTLRLTFDEECRLEHLVLKSVRSRYDGDLERFDDRDGGFCYGPFDVDSVHDLLIALWGKYFTPDQLGAFERELRDDAVDREEWGPRAWCDEDLEEEEARERDYRDYVHEELERARSSKSKLPEDT